jgi:outer membrane receptor protein involved in Fe transport
MKNFNRLILMIALIFSVAITNAQTTTSGMNGKVTNEAGEVLPGATVLATHTPTGSQYGTITNEQGFYHIPTMNVGGPYKVVVTFVGYKKYSKENIYLTLGQTLKINVKLSESSETLEGVEIIANADDLFDGNRTGAQTIIGGDDIQKLPSISGDLNDFTRLTPQANNVGSGISIAGMNNRFNAVYVDGTVNNDVFGLAANGMNGGQTGVNAISYEAIDQVQVVVAPYDIRQSGFAGAGINAVTKSGTNQFKGSAYFKYRNQDFAGKTPGNVEDSLREKLADFTAKTYGFTVGGPIIKNKAFFFVNAEFQDDQTPQPFDMTNYEGDSDAATITALQQHLINEYGYDPGAFGTTTEELKGQKILARLDFNLSKNHKLMARYQYTKGENYGYARSYNDEIAFANSGVYFPSTTHTAAIELKSTFGNKYSNNLKIGYTNVNDDRGALGDNFPGVTIKDGNGGEISFGTEVYSTGNQLKQSILTLTDNFQIYQGRHTITIGTHNEYYDIYNMFMRKAYGEYYYESLDQFYNNDPASEYTIGYSLIDNIYGDGSAAAADFQAFQFGIYAQDEIQVNDKLKVTAGLRLDMPMFLTEPEEIPGFNDEVIPQLEEIGGYDLEGAQSGKMPFTQLLWSPRVGFNYDVMGDESLQIRGGSGIFTSRIPFVWPAGSYTNNGMLIGSYYSENDEIFNPNWDQQTIGAQTQGNGGQVDLYAEDFKFPQIWRSNLAIDAKLPGGIIGTVEFMYSKTLNNILWKDVNMKPAWGNATGTPDNRPLYNRYDEIDSEYSQIMLGTNTNKGYTYNATAQLQKSWKWGLDASVAYTYGKAKSVYDGTSSQNSSQYNYLVSGPDFKNDAALTISDFDLGHRIVAYVNYEKEWIKHLKTGISVFYNGQSGQPYSYIYNDWNASFTKEAKYSPQLIYIPENQSDIILIGNDDFTAQEQWDALNAFIEGDEYLSEHRGEYAERNAARLPFTNLFNLKFTQDVFVNVADRRQTVQIGVDLFNVGNMINKEWGNIYNSSYGSYKLIDFEGFQQVADPTTGEMVDSTVPTFSFEAPKDDKPYYLNDGGIYSSRWSALFSVRYFF